MAGRMKQARPRRSSWARRMTRTPPTSSPGQPARTYPMWIASSVEFGPGIRYVAPRRSRNCSRVSHRRRRTTSSSISAMWAAGPPKPITPSLRNRRATSPTRPGCPVAPTSSRAAASRIVALRAEYTRGGGARMRGDVKATRGRARGEGHDRGTLSSALVAWLDQEPLHGRAVLDVGTGTGRLALYLAPRARRVLGIDTDGGALVEAQRHALRAGIANVLFVVADAEQVDYRTFGPTDLVVAHLCMSDAIITRAAASLPAGGALAFAAFHTDQWRETGHVSRFAYAPDRARAVLEEAGLRVERLQVEQEATRFASEAEALARTADLRPRWEADGRWEAWERFVAEGGRTLTQSRLVVLARRGTA